jgi:ABC-type transport system involved in multi-copper enzyme maturation permease subunit
VLYTLYSGGILKGLFSVPLFISIGYIALKAANIFKDGESDGTTLLLTAKPYTRFEIIISKLLIALFHTFIPALAILLAFILASINSRDFSYDLKIALIFSLGLFIINLIFLSISMFFALVVGKVGTLLLTSFFFIIIFSASPIIAALSRSAKPGIQSVGFYYNNVKHEEYMGISKDAHSD